MNRSSFAVFAVLLFSFATARTYSQSLAEAAEKAAAIKAARVANGEWVPIVSAADPTVPIVTPASLPAMTLTTESAAPAKVEPVIEPSTLAKNQAAGAALLSNRLAALHALQTDRDRNAAHYQDACAGRETSAGWMIRGVLVTTRNAETPACRTIASDLANQTTAFDLGHKAIAETARTSGIFPGVLRDLFRSNGLPE